MMTKRVPINESCSTACRRPRQKPFFFSRRNLQESGVNDELSKPNHNTTSRNNDGGSIFQRTHLQRAQSEIAIDEHSIDLDKVEELREKQPRKKSTPFTLVRTPSRLFLKASTRILSMRSGARTSPRASNKVAPAPVQEVNATSQPSVTFVSSSSSFIVPPRSKMHSSLMQKSPARTECTQDGSSSSLQHDTWYYSSNHVLVNRERTERGIPPLMRSICLDKAAKIIATLAAHTNDCIDVPEPYHGNVISGMSIRHIHFVTMETDCDERDNLLNPEFEEFGMATHKGRDGRLYICQLFDQRRLEI